VKLLKGLGFIGDVWGGVSFVGLLILAALAIFKEDAFRRPLPAMLVTNILLLVVMVIFMVYEERRICSDKHGVKKQHRPLYFFIAFCTLFAITMLGNVLLVIKSNEWFKWRYVFYNWRWTSFLLTLCFSIFPWLWAIKIRAQVLSYLQEYHKAQIGKHKEKGNCCRKLASAEFEPVFKRSLQRKILAFFRENPSNSKAQCAAFLEEDEKRIDHEIEDLKDQERIERKGGQWVVKDKPARNRNSAGASLPPVQAMQIQEPPLSHLQEQILGYFRRAPSGTPYQCSQLIRESEKIIKDEIRKLQRMNRIERKGSYRHGIWVVIDRP